MGAVKEYYSRTMDDDGVIHWWRVQYLHGTGFGVPCCSPREYLAHALLGWLL